MESDRVTQSLAANAGSLRINAVKDLARCAALEELVGKREGTEDSGIAVIHFTFLRALCSEFGLEYEPIIAAAREYAAAWARTS